MKLRQYQLDLKAGLYDSWSRGNRNVCLVSPTGSGKTVIMGSIAKDQTTPGVAIAHRTELVGQISLAMARMGIEHNIIGSSSTTSFCIQQQIAELGRKYYNPHALVTVGSVDTIKARSAKLGQWAAQQTWWMVDECFVAGTLVDGRTIETLRIGDMVTGFNTVTGGFEKRRINRLFKSPAPPVILRVDSGHHSLHLTSGHPVWTKRGWVRAGDLTLDDSIYANPMRVQSRATQTSSVGPQERRSFVWQRVENISFLERDDPLTPGDGHVYNIEVDGLHTYIADGVVVHNCHHLLQKNKWGEAVTMFPRARGVGVTATPLRADRKSLHADQGGVFNDMIVGPTMRTLIDQGSLCDYRIFAPPQSIDLTGVKIGGTGDYSQPGLRQAAHKSKIVGDVVSHYQRFAAGLRGITFVVDVEQAIELAKAFNEAGVPAMAISAKTPDAVRAEAVRKLRNGTLRQLVNVDLFGEGFDVPAVEVVSMARPTMSYGLYVQQFGRALRTLEGKSHGIIIDHVGNVKQHGLPDAPRKWTLLNEERGTRGARDVTVTPVTTCLSCFSSYANLRPDCPFCGYRPEPAGRSRPEQVDGDLVEMDPAALAALRGDIEAADARLLDPLAPRDAAPYVVAGIRNKARERAAAQETLREMIATWAGYRKADGDDDHAIYRRFFHTFGTDVMSAQLLNRADADALTQQIKDTLNDPL